MYRFPTKLTDPGPVRLVIPTNKRNAVCRLVTAAGLTSAETARTLAAPLYPDQRLKLDFMTKGTEGAAGIVQVVVAHAIQGTYTTITFNNAGESCELVSACSGTSTYVWRLAWAAGPALS